MSATDRKPTSTPLNSHRKDFNLYTGTGSGGAGALTVSGQQRYSYFTDISKFDTYLRAVNYLNASFQVYSDAGGVNRQPLYFGIANSDDRPTSDIIANATVANGLKFAGAPPYNISLTDLGAPFSSLNAAIQNNRFNVDGSFFYDQGRWIYAYITPVGSTFGNNSKLLQKFTPQSDRILNLAISNLFFDATHFSTSDHTLRDDIVVEIWDPNKNVIYSETISKFAPTDTGSVSANYPYTWTHIDTWSTDVCDDGKSYWRTLTGYKLQGAAPIPVQPGQVHYICIRQASNHASNTYGAGDNRNAAGTALDPTKGQYINGDYGFSTFAGTAFTSFGITGGAIGFATTRNIGRFCLTVCWDSAAYYWYNPNTILDQIKVNQVDSDRRI